MIGLTMGLLGTGLVHLLTAVREKVKINPELVRLQNYLNFTYDTSHYITQTRKSMHAKDAIAALM